MELIDQHTKKIMEGCKRRAYDAGLRFQDETLEYIVTNRDMIELSPKVMIPTLYDYWVHDVEVLKEKGRYELYPGNPYETVINTRPAISFYNDNNPDWMNVMIFYHVLAHIDFFQNNAYFRSTWDYDFTGVALSDKRTIARLRSEKGRWLDYVIEFTRGIDNLVGYHRSLSDVLRPVPGTSKRMDYYFDIFLQKEKKVRINEYVQEIERYNQYIETYGEFGEESFFSEIKNRYPEFETMFEKQSEKKAVQITDLIEFLLDRSEFLKKEENIWMRSVIGIVRKTSLFFQPQIRTKIINEGWASYWHDTLFLMDDRIQGHEVDYARVNAHVTSIPRVGLNPYALGMRLFQHLEETADKGKISYEFERIKNVDERKKFDKHTGKGKEFIFRVRENLSDFMFINTFIDQDFIDKHRLFVAGKRLNQSRMVWEYYVKSRKAEDYKAMVLDSMYHPPYIEVNEEKTNRDTLYLVHRFENKPLVSDYIANTMLGIEYLWDGEVKLETHEVASIRKHETEDSSGMLIEEAAPEVFWEKVLYTMKNRRLSKRKL